MRIKRRNTTVAAIILERGKNVRTLPMGAQILSVLPGDDHVILWIVGDHVSTEPDEDRQFLVTMNNEELPSLQMPLRFVGSTVVHPGFHAHVFEIDADEDPRLSPSRKGRVNIHNTLGGIAPGGVGMQIGQVIGHAGGQITPGVYVQ